MTERSLQRKPVSRGVASWAVASRAVASRAVASRAVASRAVVLLALTYCAAGCHVLPSSWPEKGRTAPAGPQPTAGAERRVASDVALVSYQVPDLPVPPEPPALGRAADLPAPRSLPALSLRTVTESVYWSFPALEAAMRELEIAEGKELAARGEFDLKLKSEHLAAPLGFYQNYRQLAKLEQALYRGGSVYGQYRLGDGDIQPWYGERETNEGGEFKVGFVAPLFRDRAIDARRADLFQTTLRRQQVDPAVQAQLLEFTFFAADAYWSWVAAGRSYDVQQALLRVTVERNSGIEQRVQRQDLAAIELLQNRRLIASRETKLIEAERKLQQAAIKLSLFLRDEQGQTVQPAREQLPAGFPEPQPFDADELDRDLGTARTARPELRELDLLRQQAEIDLSLGRNQLLPALNATLEASKDVGAAASKKGDKTPFELEAGLLFDMPLQRRKAQGKLLEAEGKLNQLAAKRRFTEDKIAVQVRDAASALTTAYDRIAKARDNARLAKQLEQAERDRFRVGDSDLLRVALQEGAAIEAELLEIEAFADYFKAAAALRAATAADPLE